MLTFPPGALRAGSYVLLCTCTSIGSRFDKKRFSNNQTFYDLFSKSDRSLQGYFLETFGMNKNVWQIPNKRERVKSSVWCDQYDRGREVQEAQTDPIYKMRREISLATLLQPTLTERFGYMGHHSGAQVNRNGTTVVNLKFLSVARNSKIRRGQK